MALDYEKQIKGELSESLKMRIVNHKQRFKQLFKGRYQEMIPTLIHYKNADTVAVDFLKVEIALRNNYDVVIGQTTQNNIQVLGTINSADTSTNPTHLWTTKTLTKKDITFIIPSHLQMKFYKEISFYDSCQTGNFTILRNKSIRYGNDMEILNHYIDELAEIVLSRFSISMQVKMSTLFLGEPNDESMKQLISELYNGNPYIEGSKLFDPSEQIIELQNSGLAQNFQELKREYQNKISELNTMLGINSLAVEKASGVSDEEANANRGFTTGNANIYLDGRNHGLRKLNQRFQLELESMYNDEVVSEFARLEKFQEYQKNTGGESSNENNSDPV